MANLKEVRDRIGSVKNTQQITRAMKMVAASKLRRAQTAIQQMRPYANKLNEMLSNILSNVEGDVFSTFSTEREVKSACIVVVTSDRGLCGAFNNNISKATMQRIKEEYSEVYESGNLHMINIGKKGLEYFQKRLPNIQYHKEYVNLFNDLSFENTKKVGQLLMDKFEEGIFDKIDVAYGQFKNPAVQYPKVEQFLPVETIEAQDTGGKEIRADYIFEPDMKGLLEYLIPNILLTQFQKYLLDTNASEHGARMTAMDAATDNAGELLRELKISYNKARQEAITKEILEIVGGAAALENS